MKNLIYFCLLLIYAKSATLNDFMSFTNINWMVSKGNRLAWVELTLGVTNIFVAEGPQFTRRQLTQLKTDAGLVIDTLTFNSRGDGIFYNLYPSDGANPLSLATPMVPNIMFTNWDGNMTVSWQSSAFLGAVSPNDGVAYSVGPIVFFKNSPNAIPTILFELQGDQGSIDSMSFLGSDLVFSNNRYDHGFIGIFRNNTKRIDWLSPSFDTDIQPTVCSAKGLVAFYRQWTLTDQNARPIRTEWSVWVADSAHPDRPARQVYADKNVGWPLGYADSAFGQRPLIFTEDCSRVIFLSEVSGWLNVVVARTDGSGFVTTQMQCEVQSYIYSNFSLYTADNCGTSLNTRTLHRIPDVTASSLVFQPLLKPSTNSLAGLADGGSGLALLPGPRLAFLSTSFNTSTAVQVLNLSDSSIIQVSSGAFAASPLMVVPKLISFTSLDGLFTIYGQLFLPPNLNKSIKNPAVIFTHGGPMRQMFTAMHFSLDYSQLYAQNQYLTFLGFPVLSINYRRGIGYGRAFRLCEKCGYWGGNEYLDVLGGNMWFSNQPYIDPSRIGIYGLSYGGLNCLQAVARNSDRFAVGVANAPVFNWISEGRFDQNNYFNYNPQVPLAINVGPEPNLASPLWPKRVDENMNLAWLSSPSAFTDNISVPVLVIHGDSDRNVDVQESIGLINSLRNRGYSKIYSMMFPNERHGLALYKNELIAAQATIDFLAAHLGE